MSILDSLRERRRLVFTEAKALADKAANENRSFDSQEESTWQRLNAELDSFDTRIGQVVDQEQRQADAGAAFDRVTGRPGSFPGTYRSGGNSELRAFIRGEGPRVFDLAPQRVDWPAVQTRALSVGVGTAGGDTVPTDFYNRLMTHLVASTPILQVAQVVNTTGGNALPVPTTTAHSSASIVAEGATIGESDPAFSQVTLGAYKYGCLIQVSRELLDDTGVDVEGYLAQETGTALGNALGVHAATGDGSSKPRGYTTDALLGVTGGVAAAPTYDELVDVYYSVIAGYRRQAVWLCNDATIGALRKIKDANDVPLLVPTATGESFTIFGRPVVSDPFLPDVATGSRSLVFGDMSRYFVRIAGGIRFERSDDYAFDQDLITFRALLRADAATTDKTGAIKFYTSG